MEKRTVLAIALSFLVLLMWQLFFAKPKEPIPPTEDVVTEETTPEEVAVGEKEEPQPVKKPLPKPITTGGGEEKVIEVETPLYRVMITTGGGRISAFYLKDFKETIEEDSPPVNIVSDGVEELSPKIAFDTNMGSFEEDLIYRVDNDADHIVLEGEDSLTLYWEGDNFRVEKIYTFNPDNYGVGLDVRVTNLSDTKVDGEMSVSLFEFLEVAKKKKSFALFRRYQYLKSYLVLAEGKLEKSAATKIKPNEEKEILGNIGWFGFDSKYFIYALVVEGMKGDGVEEVREKEDLIRGTYHVEEFTIPAGEFIEEEMELYLGPKESHAMDAVGYSLSDAIDYGFFAFLSIPLVMLLNLFFSVFKNYGVAIILITVVVRLILYPITYKSMKSMKDMQKIQPLITEIREKYKGDKEKMNQEVMRLYQSHKINPLGGCLPLVLQLPIFIALYKALFVAIELRQSPFCFWIQDLSEMDPYYVTPIVMGLSYFLQQKMTPTSADPTQQKMMMLMPVVFTVIFLNLPSGLVLYFFVSNLLSIAQQIYLNKIKKD